MIKILFLMDTLTGGGAEKVLRTLVNHMNQAEFEITVQTLEQGDATGLLAPGIRYRAINRCKTAAGRKLMGLWVRLCAELKWLYPLYIRDDYDIEVAYLECGPTKFLAQSTNRGALRLAWVHCDLEKKGLRNTPKVRAQYGAYDQVVCVSENAKEAFEWLFGKVCHTAVVYNVNDEKEILSKADAFAVPGRNVPVIAAVGRLSREKGVDRLLEACKRLAEDGYAFGLWIIGDGPERQTLEHFAETYGLGDCVSFRGFQENPYPYMRAADLIVCPSRYEGFSTVVTEALILGKPVVTTPCSGMRELLGESEYGLITEDSVDGIYHGLKKMLDEPDTLRHYAQAARRRGKDFSKEILLARTEGFFREELEKKRMN